LVVEPVPTSATLRPPSRRPHLSKKTLPLLPSVSVSVSMQVQVQVQVHPMVR